MAGVLATMHVDMEIDRRLVRLVDLLTRAGCRPCAAATARTRHTGWRGWHLPGPAEPVHRPDAIAVRWGGRRQYFAVPAEGRLRSTLAAFQAAAAEHASVLDRLSGEAPGLTAMTVERASAIYAARGFPTLQVVTVRCGPLGIDDTGAADL